MVQSEYCHLKGRTPKEKRDLGECTYDEGGYFIVNGSEKVLIAQERQAYNRVYCFKRRAPSKNSWTAEIRSDVSTGPIALDCPVSAGLMCVTPSVHAGATQQPSTVVLRAANAAQRQ